MACSPVAARAREGAGNTIPKILTKTDNSGQVSVLHKLLPTLGLPRRFAPAAEPDFRAQGKSAAVLYWLPTDIKARNPKLNI